MNQAWYMIIQDKFTVILSMIITKHQNKKKGKWLNENQANLKIPVFSLVGHVLLKPTFPA